MLCQIIARKDHVKGRSSPLSMPCGKSWGLVRMSVGDLDLGESWLEADCGQWAGWLSDVSVVRQPGGRLRVTSKIKHCLPAQFFCPAGVVACTCNSATWGGHPVDRSSNLGVVTSSIKALAPVHPWWGVVVGWFLCGTSDVQWVLFLTIIFIIHVIHWVS